MIKKIYRIAVVLIMAAALVAAMISMAKGEELVTMYVICSDSYVNVRERPSTRATIGGRLDFGDEVQVAGELVEDRSGTEWYRVEDVTEQGHGYVCANYLTTSRPERCDKMATVSASGRVAVYRRVNGPRKTWAKDGTTVRISIQSDAWCLTDKGWIKTEYLNIDDGAEQGRR